jgi:hypothetical protein
MDGTSALAQYRDQLLEVWFERALGVYAEEAVVKFRGVTDRFANPVGTGVRANLERILDGLLAGRPPEAAALDGILRVRAVQEMPASKALAFLADLPEILAGVIDPHDDLGRREADDAIRHARAYLLAGFDTYMNCREQVWKIRATELRSRSQRVIEGLNAWRERRDAAAGPDAMSWKEVSE